MTFAYLLFIILFQKIRSASFTSDLMLGHQHVSTFVFLKHFNSSGRENSLSSTSSFSVLPSKPSLLQRNIQESKSSSNVTFMIYPTVTHSSTIAHSQWERYILLFHLWEDWDPQSGPPVSVLYCSSWARLHGFLHTHPALSITTPNFCSLPTP